MPSPDRDGDIKGNNKWLYHYVVIAASYYCCETRPSEQFQEHSLKAGLT